ncbi:glutamate--cysteine ligase [Photobacterium jeanii]|uniref:Glutamate--cysteine ligase n=1 Tax=Photobacterium jeanii TaxID=858640 RepID=A0A178K3Z8_9GAMM|nr:glutamate--cysteine ligase [Photobacterium jeanii]
MTQAALAGIRRGIERELVRTSPQGELTTTAHPTRLGAALTHPYITTDFAEAQLELVTPALTDRQATFSTLTELHQFVARNIASDETLWAASMPPVLPAEHDIRIADYGKSNAGRLKVRYREGLANRYGKRMQLISGIHYNFSLPNTVWQLLYQQQTGVDVEESNLAAFISERYFHLIRNVLRHGWVIPYLFGATPALDKSYLQGREHNLTQWDTDTYYLPWATSLRVSNLGYSSSEQSAYPLSFNNQKAYLTDLYRVLTKPSERYTHFDHEQQLNASVLQLENELYGSVRPKIVSAELRPLMAMCHHGVEYIELRSLDNNPYLPLGINEAQSQFLDLFLTYCALAPSPEIDEQERQLLMARQELVATQGRQPDLMLPTLDGDVLLAELGHQLLDAMGTLAAGFDQHNDIQHDKHVSAISNQSYFAAIERERAKFNNSELTPSAKLLADMKKHQLGHNALIHALSEQHTTQHRESGLDPVAQQKLVDLAQESLVAQAQREAQQEMSFDEFLKQKNNLQCDCEI